MPTFEILCLANSIKRRGSCIAGLRLDGGGWIRPVALTPYGELYPAHYRLQNGSSPQLFDWIRIAFVEQRVSAHQPENWLIADHPWELLSRGLSEESAPVLQSHLITGPALFGDVSKRVLSDRFEAEPAASSLCLIHPRKLSWIIQNFPNNPHKASANFQLAGVWYRLPITDPNWLPAFRALPPGEYPVTACGIAADVEVLLTVSLSEPFEGYCYKLIAGILPLDCVPSALPRPVEKKPPQLAAHAGTAWDTAEEATLMREFEFGASLGSIARAHGRTLRAIEARLIRLGKIAV